MTSTTVITSSKSEQLFYRIASAPDEMSLAAATLQIGHVATEGTDIYNELIRASAARRIFLDQQRLTARN